ncbi:MAG: sigma-54 interaction domain-containing protein [Bacteroidales bacterium]
MAKPDLLSVKQRFGIIGNSEALNRAIDIALQVAPTDLAVLITGESGVGKETFPQIIHQFSARKHGAYIAVNCGAIPEGTIDSELFGHEKGSFTGALGDRKGYFEVADGGTIFLDEVGELPMATQARLLRILESGEFMKVGSSKVQKTNVRVVAATNINFKRAITDGKFREDLFYRLNTIPIMVAPLRERSEDIYLLFRKFAADFAQKYRMPAIQLNEEAKSMLTAFHFPGNIRQLKNITEQISIIETLRDITPEILAQYLPHTEIVRSPSVSHKEEEFHSFSKEREVIYQILFDMKKEVTELRQIVHDLMSGNRPVEPQSTVPIRFTQPEPQQLPNIVTKPQTLELSGSINHITAEDAVVFDDTEEYVEASLSLNDLEREAIKKALEKHQGRRKMAADELNISERTLYRKIKEYGLN